uniref:Tetratricopeptide repeat protein n=1 Tax=Dechloromonas aromatica (strain RCB) TaxID=159087 RepID=Q47AH0_DECAR
MSADWFRNTTWDEATERAFDEKLRRARRKEQYLRIQGNALARSHPEVALKLLDRYFALHDDFDHAQAYVDRATALLVLGRVEDAIAAYEAALARESVFPNLRTQAYLDLPFLVASCGLRGYYNRAKELLALHESRLVFPVEHFRWHAANALIKADSGETEIASTHAKRALCAASDDHSGFRYHPSIGLVTAKYDEIILKLKVLYAA